MNILLRILPLFLLFASMAVSGQQPVTTQRDSLQLFHVLPVSARFATADALGNIYLITPQNAVEKYAPDGRLLTRYTNNRVGPATLLDASNPLKLLVWYADFRTAVFLDRSLTLLGTLDLVAAGFPETRAVGVTRDGKLWIYDEAASVLRKIEPDDGRSLLESQRLDLLFPARLGISGIQESDAGVFVVDTLQGLLAFDAYGQFLKTYPFAVKNRSWQVVENRFFFLADRAVQVEELGRPLMRKIVFPEGFAAGAAVWLGAGRVMVTGKNGLEVWRWE